MSDKEGNEKIEEEKQPEQEEEEIGQEARYYFIRFTSIITTVLYKYDTSCQKGFVNIKISVTKNTTRLCI